MENYRQIRNGEAQSELSAEQLTAEIDRLTIELNELQSKALYFANEAYHTGPAAEHVVLGQQLGLGIPLDIDEYLVSINEQVGFAMEQATADKSLGKALWKSSKYMDRVNNAIALIEEKDPNLFDLATKEQIDKMTDLFDELILIKKEKKNYYGMDEKEKAEAAIAVAQEKGFDVKNVEELRQKLLEFNIRINTQIRNGRSGKYNSRPSELNKWPDYEHQQDLSQIPSVKGQNLAQASIETIELPEFG